MTAFADSVARLAAHGCASGDETPDGSPAPPGPIPHGSSRDASSSPPGAPPPEKGSPGSPDKGAVGGFIAAVGLLSRLCGAVSAGLIVASMLVVCQMVFVRYVLNGSTIWQSEAVIYMMIAATLVGLPYVQLIRGHVNVELFPMYLRAAPRKALAAACLVTGMVIALIIGGYGLELVIEAKSGGWLSESVWAPPLWIPYMAMPVGFLILFAQFAADLLALLTGREAPFGLSDDADSSNTRRH